MFQKIIGGYKIDYIIDYSFGSVDFSNRFCYLPAYFSNISNLSIGFGYHCCCTGSRVPSVDYCNQDFQTQIKLIKNILKIL